MAVPKEILSVELEAVDLTLHTDGMVSFQFGLGGHELILTAPAHGLDQYNFEENEEQKIEFSKSVVLLLMEREINTQGLSSEAED